MNYFFQEGEVAQRKRGRGRSESKVSLSGELRVTGDIYQSVTLHEEPAQKFRST